LLVELGLLPVDVLKTALMLQEAIRVNEISISVAVEVLVDLKLLMVQYGADWRSNVSLAEPIDKELCLFYLLRMFGYPCWQVRELLEQDIIENVPEAPGLGKKLGPKTWESVKQSQLLANKLRNFNAGDRAYIESSLSMLKVIHNGGLMLDKAMIMLASEILQGGGHWQESSVKAA
jgi:hypothetical protein